MFSSTPKQSNKRNKQVTKKYFKPFVFFLCLFTALPAYSGQEQEKGTPIALRVTFGVADTVAADWSGTLGFAGADSKSSIVRMEKLGLWNYWRYTGGFRFSGAEVSWQDSSRYVLIPDWIRPWYDSHPEAVIPIQPLIMLVHMNVDESAVVKVTTSRHGFFQFSPHAMKPGAPSVFLGGTVKVERVFPAVRLTSTEYEPGRRRYNDFPAVCAASDGTVYTVYVSTIEGPPESNAWEPFETPPADFSYLAEKVGGDQLMVVTEKNGVIAESAAITGSGKDIYKVAAVMDSRDRLWVVWSENSGGNWDLFMKRLEKGTWRDTVRLTTDSGPDINPVLAAVKNGTLHLVWQGYRRGNFDILHCTIDSTTGAVTREETVWESPANEWEPALAVGSGGEVAVAWDTYEKDDYDVYFTTITPGGVISKARPAAASLRFEAYPSITYDSEDRLWVVWEETGENWGKDSGNPDDVALDKGEELDRGRYLGLACFKDGKVFTTPVSLADALPKDTPWVWGNYINERKLTRIFQSPCPFQYSPKLYRDRDGKIILLYRHFEDMREAFFFNTLWVDYAVCFDGESWSSPVYLSGSDGLTYQKPFAAVLPDGELCAVFSSDNRGRRPQALEINHKTLYTTTKSYIQFFPNYDIWMTKVRFEGGSRPFVLKPTLPVTREAPKQGVRQEARDVKQIRTYTTRAGGKEYRIYRGEFHRHSNYSYDGILDSTIEDNFRYGFDCASLDWIGNGDHDNGGQEYTWYMTQKYSDVFHIPGVFEPMFSYERSVPSPDGHRNVLFARRGIRVLPRLKFTRRDENEKSPDTAMLYRYLHYFNGISSPHTTATGAGTDWRDNDPEVEPVMEIYQGARSSYEYPGAPRTGGATFPYGWYWDALKKGIKMGIQSSSDHHTTHVDYTMVYCENLSREAVLDALKKRHCYGATDNIVLDVRMGGHFMGDIFESRVSAKLEITVIGTAPIKTVDIIKNCSVVHSVAPGTQKIKFTWEDELQAPGESWYYVRVLQENGELAWSSPLWIDYTK